jgi:hypothetical protein
MHVTILLLLWDEAMALLNSGICQTIISYMTVKYDLGTLLKLYSYLAEFLRFSVNYNTFNVRIITDRSGSVLFKFIRRLCRVNSEN